MGGIFSKKPGTRCFSARKQDSRGIFSKLLITTSPGFSARRRGAVKKMSTVQLPPVMKSIKLNQNLPQFSTLSFMARDKSPLTVKAIPEVFLNLPELPDNVVNEAIPEINIERVLLSEKLDLPECLIYEGYHTHGYHVFVVSAEKFVSMPDEKNCLAIEDAISKVIDSNDRCVIIYKDSAGKTAYLPDIYSTGDELFNRLCNRFGNQILRIVYFKPSWFVCCSMEKSDSLFSDEVLQKLSFTNDTVEFARLTGFPGEIKTKC